MSIGKNPLELNILFKLTSRSRPMKFKQTVHNIMQSCSLQNYFILVSADVDDETMYNKEIHEFCKERGIIIIYGTSKSKIDAINRDVNAVIEPHWDILVNMSDDMAFRYIGFDVDIRKQFEKGLDWFVHFPDNNRKDLCTISIMGRDYYNRFRYIYHPSYITVCSDEEATEVAKLQGRYKYIDTVLVDHFHPGYDTKYWDDLYRRNEDDKLYQLDRENLRLRRFNNFPV